ncbi:hypothetical protein ACFOLJ_03180 [Rugamonas sp. CCM 8940]|uniref:hypothetical protein n=1 Tax=Rugamonas sp. CCM 8940 TaxID=2765359 RepID=UPI0018F304A5|nr:hypothetical protein [Rugamonas sp. CCM 8940]MBJ7311943.1 hypothetical protein [Rugamonas sp. CCM 8940]
MAAQGAASVLGSFKAIADISMTGAASEAVDAANAYEKMKKKGRDAALQLI